MREGDPRQVLQRPRRTALVAGRAEGAERLRHEAFRLLEVAAEEVRHTQPAEHVGRARVVVELAPQRQRFTERRLGDVVGAHGGFALAEQRQGNRFPQPVVSGSCVGERGERVVAGIVEHASMDAGPGAAEERGPPRLRVLASEQRERPPRILDQ